MARNILKASQTQIELVDWQILLKDVPNLFDYFSSNGIEWQKNKRQLAADKFRI